MEKLTNVNLAKMHKVSEKSIRNWIKSSIDGKLDLQIIKEEGKTYIANTSTNHLTLQKLSKQGKKFKNRRVSRLVIPTPEFYKVFNEKQIIDIITDLEVYREIDLKFGYFHKGAESYNDYIEKSFTQASTNANTPTNTVELLHLNIDYIYSLVKDFKNINIIDIGPGNSMPLKNFLTFLHSKKLLKKYIALDYSPDMLGFSEVNINKWFDGEVVYESYIRDVNSDVFRDLLFRNSLSEDNKDTINLVLFFGSTIENQRRYDRPLYVIKNSMGVNDLFFLGHRLDTDVAKLTLSFNQSVGRGKDLELFFVVLDLLNITEDLYEIERFYDEQTRSRIMRINLKYDITIEISTESFKKKVKLYQKDNILLFRHKHHTYAEVVNELSEVGFCPIHASTSLDRDQILVMSKIKTISN